MKIKITLDAEVTMGGTRLGYMPQGTSYADLVKVFGKPNIEPSPDGKIKAEWLGRTTEHYACESVRFCVPGEYKVVTLAWLDMSQPEMF